MTEAIDWNGFKNALAAFAGDYGIVNHADTSFTSPLTAPNGIDVSGNRQYSVTQIPPEMTEADFRHGLEMRQTLFLSCMDRDAVGPAYAILETQYGAGTVAVVSVGGVLCSPKAKEPRRLIKF